MSQTAFTMEAHRALFRDDASFCAFVDAIKSASRTDLSLIFAGQEIIGAVLSPKAAKKVLSERMVLSIAKNPSLLSEIADRIVNDEIVE